MNRKSPTHAHSLDMLPYWREYFLSWPPDTQFVATKFQLEKDDILVAYTDGIMKAANACDELWGLEGLESLLRACSQMAPKEIVKRILAEVSDFANGEPQRDDATVALRRPLVHAWRSRRRRVRHPPTRRDKDISIPLFAEKSSYTSKLSYF